MRRMVLCLPALLLGLITSCGGGGGSAPVQSGPPVDPRLAEIKQAIGKVTPAEKAIIEKTKAMKPEVNGQVAGKSLIDIIDDYAKNKGPYDIIPIGWEAHQKKNQRWKVVFHYQDFNKAYQTAEWEYDPAETKLYPFDMDNAKVFWTGVGAAASQSPSARK